MVRRSLLLLLPCPAVSTAATALSSSTAEAAPEAGDKHSAHGWLSAPVWREKCAVP
jgi:hypothetical protein